MSDVETRATHGQHALETTEIEPVTLYQKLVLYNPPPDALSLEQLF